MIVAVAGFLLIVSLFMWAAAWATDAGLRRIGRPTRWVWLAALAAPLGLLTLPLLVPAGGADLVAGALGSSVVFELPGLVVDGGSELGGWLSGGLGGLWVLSSLGLAGLLFSTQGRLLRERGAWTVSSVVGREVYLSADRGPAVTGVVRPWIVLPRWALTLPGRELDLVVLHEEEHLRARDTQLLAAALALVVLTPWNPLSWLKLRGLKVAMEVDCDRRVLRRAPDPAAYGGSLISVAARSSGHSLGLAAFTEKGRSLETRILTMTQKRSRWTPLRTALLGLVAALLGVQACSIESPITFTAAEESGEGPAGSVDIREGPTFTPFTVAPSIANRSEVVEAMRAEYPPLLRDAGIGGRVVVWFFIDENGDLVETRIEESSGHVALDDAALRVADAFRFSPALNKDEAVPVWVQFPITFQASGVN